MYMVRHTMPTKKDNRRGDIGDQQSGIRWPNEVTSNSRVKHNTRGKGKEVGVGVHSKVWIVIVKKKERMEKTLP